MTDCIANTPKPGLTYLATKAIRILKQFQARSNEHDFRHTENDGCGVMFGIMEPSIDTRDFAQRWRRARIRALLAVGVQVRDDEHSALFRLASLEEVASEKLLRIVFDCSRALGRSLAAYTNGPWSRNDIVRLLPETDVPCLQGEWTESSDGHADFLKRSNCVFGQSVHACTYWREAVDGLVMGLGDDTRYARYERSDTDGACVDAFYDAGHPEYRFGTVPDEIQSAFGDLRKLLDRQGIRLSLHGYAEGALYYRLRMRSGTACGASKTLMLQSFQREAARLYPHMRLIDDSPRAVIGEM